MAKSDYPASAVDFIISTSVYREKCIIEPAMAAFVQKELNINPGFSDKNSFSFDLMNGAAGMLSGVQVLSSILNSGTAQVGLLVGGDSCGDLTVNDQYPYVPSGSALILDISPNPDRGFGSVISKTYDMYTDAYKGIVTLEIPGGHTTITRIDELPNLYVRCAVPVFNELLQQENISNEELDYVFASQISKEFIKDLAKGLKLPSEKVVDVTDQLGGDTLTTSPFLAMDIYADQGHLQPGMRCVFLTVGSGITVAGAVYNY